MLAVVQSHAEPQDAHKVTLVHVSFTSILVRDSLGGKEASCICEREDEVKPDRQATVNNQ